MPVATVKPYSWPQDQLQIPNGFGGMPPLDYGNENVVAAEWFTLTAEFDYAPNTAAFTQKNVILETPQDGDFWVDSIGAVSWLNDTSGGAITKDLQRFLAGVVSITDTRTGRNLIYGQNPVPLSHPAGSVFPPNSIPINFFRKLPQSGAESQAGQYTGDTPLPNGFRVTQTLIQPFVVTRQGGLQVTFTSLEAPGNTQTYNIYVSFNGWKEYAHASQ